MAGPMEGNGMTCIIDEEDREEYGMRKWHDTGQ
jgi:hypothetical protein